MATFKNSIYIFILLQIVSLKAQINNFDIIYQDLMKKYAAIQIFEADFTQTNYWNDADIEKESQGKFYYNSTKLLLDYSDPDGQKIIVDSCCIKLYDSSSNQMMITEKAQSNLKPQDMIKQYWTNSQKTILSTPDDTLKILLETNDEQQITIQIENNIITYLEISDLEGNIVSYKFYNIKINLKIAEEVFEIKIPEDVNLIDTRK